MKLGAMLLALLVAAGSGSAAAQVTPRKKKPAPAAQKPQAAPAPSAESTAPPPADASPMAELKKSNAALKKLMQARSPSWSPERDVRNAEVRKLVGNFLDFEELSRRALGKHWEGLSPRQRTDFVATLRDLVERNYVNQIHGQAEYELRFDKEERDGREATVWATLITKPKKKKVTVALEYKLLWKDGRWVVYDVVTDEQSLLENYRAEFNRVISKDGFDALLKRMRKKLEEQPG